MQNKMLTQFEEIDRALVSKIIRSLQAGTLPKGFRLKNEKLGPGRELIAVLYEVYQVGGPQAVKTVLDAISHLEPDLKVLLNPEAQSPVQSGRSGAYLDGQLSQAARTLKPLLRIEEVINDYFELREQGHRYLRSQLYSSFIVDKEAQLFYWNSKNIRGDVITFFRECLGYSFEEAVAELARLAGVDLGSLTAQLPSPSPRRLPTLRFSLPLQPPCKEWRGRAETEVQTAVQMLKSSAPAGRKARAYLTRCRRLTEAIIEAFEIGVIPNTVIYPPELWFGWDDGGKNIVLPSGILFPWRVGGHIWRLRTRKDEAQREANGSKYVNIRIYPEGGRTSDHEPLYNADSLQVGKPAVLVEGEMDALTTIQSLGSNEWGIGVVATGSVSGSRRPRWLAHLAICSTVLIAYDRDEAGETASQFWLEALPNAKRWSPVLKDVNQMLQDGKDVLTWVLAGLADDSARSNP